MVIMVEPPEYEIGLASTLAIKNIKKSIFLNIPMGGILAHKNIKKSIFLNIPMGGILAHKKFI
jgi:hypothetical protein